MRKPTALGRFRYWFDSLMARGTTAQIGVLAIASLGLVLVCAWTILLLRWYPTAPAEKSNPGPVEVIWDTLVRTLSSGSIREDEGWGYRAVMLVATLGGLIIVAGLIGVISSALARQLQDFREGSSRVVESQHTVILGWSGSVLSIVSELVEANRGGRRSSIALLAQHPAGQLLDALEVAVPDRGRTRIVVRTGDPKDRASLELVSPQTAASIIIVSPEGVAQPDVEVISTVLTLTRGEQSRTSPYAIVAELRDPRMLRTANLVAPGQVRWVLAADLIGRITVQSTRHSGLSSVYTALLDFRGDEFYFVPPGTLVGLSFGDAVLAFPTASAIGIATPDSVNVDPAPETVITAADQVIVIAETAAAAVMAEPVSPDEGLVVAPSRTRETPEHTLILGHHSGCPAIVAALLHYFAPTSTVTVAAPGEAPTTFDRRGGVVSWINLDPTAPDDLATLDLARFDHVIVVPDMDDVAPQVADARTIVTLLNLRQLLSETGTRLPIVSQMLDARNRDVAQADASDDFVVSDQMVSLMLAQVSQTPRVAAVFDTLLSADGSEFHIRPMSAYVRIGEPVDFFTISVSVLRRGETPVGFRRADGTVVINPDKRALHTFGPGDAVIVLAAS